MVLRSSKLWELPTSDERDVENLENWFVANPGAINLPECSFIEKTDDLMSIVPKSKSPLRRALEKVSDFDLSPVFKLSPVRYHRRSVVSRADVDMTILQGR